MKILCISYEYPPLGGGGAAVCQGLAEALVRAGHEIDVVTSGMQSLPRYEERNGVHIYRVPCMRRHRHYSTLPELIMQVLPAYRKALALIHRRAYDLNYTHFVVPSGLVSYLLWKHTGLPYVLTAHGSDIPGYNSDRFQLTHQLIRPFWTQIMRSSAAITTPSHFLKGLINQYIEVPIQVIPNGFNAPPQISATERHDRVLVVARMFERKGIQYLIEAMGHIKTDWECWIIGDGPYRPTLQKRADQCGVSAKFLGMIDREQLMKLYQSAKIFVFPSLQENFPMVLLEAMAAGCAVITTSAAGCAEVVGNAAILVKPGDIKSLQDAIVTLLADEAAITRLSQRARERVQRFAWTRIAAEYETLFRGHANNSKLSGGTMSPINHTIS